MKVIILFMCVLAFCFNGHAQSIQVNSTEKNIANAKRKVLSTTIELEKKVVERAWGKRLKEYGKLENNKGYYAMNAVTIPPIVNAPVTLYTSVEESGEKGTAIFLFIDTGTEVLSPGSKNYEAARNFLYDFVLELYRDDMNMQISESDKAVTGAVKVHDKLVDQGDKIVNNIQKNRAEKVRLEKALIDNELDFQKLTADSTKNRLDQATAEQEINRLRNISEEKKNKLGQIK